MVRPVKITGLAAIVVKHLHDAGERFLVVQKRTSKLMRFFGVVYSLLRQNFEDYITTIGRTVYWNRKEAKYLTDAAALYHESVHVHDYSQHPAWFVVSYVVPQALAPVFWVAAAIVSFWYWPVGLALGVFGLVLLFLPSVGRTHWELRGYAASLTFKKYYGIVVDERDYYRIAKYRFANSSYVWMCPCVKLVSRKLKALVEESMRFLERRDRGELVGSAKGPLPNLEVIRKAIHDWRGTHENRN